MLLASIALIVGIVLLVWSADKFVDGAAGTARYFSISPLIIGMVIVGFGTSAPEMLVSALAAVDGNPGIALGNAYGSNIANIALILGVTALISPVVVHKKIMTKELPILVAVTALTLFLIYDLNLSRIDAIILLIVFIAIMVWTIIGAIKGKGGDFETEEEEKTPLKTSIMWLVIGLVLLIVSSRILVWGAIEIAELFGISDMIIGLTVVAIGTSLPELASSVVAARKGEHDIALGNVIGSNFFNTLAVVGIAGSIHPFDLPIEIITRDMLIMGILTLSLFFFGATFKGKLGRINRFEGLILVLIYVGYTALLVNVALSGQQ